MDSSIKLVCKLFLIILIETFFLGKIALAEVIQSKKVPYLYEIYVTKPFTDKRILPNFFPIPASISRTMFITACRGEYASATFVIHALHDIKKLIVTTTDLKSKNSSISASFVDIRVVKCWFKAGLMTNETDKCILTPELLLKDDSLILVDIENKKNYMRVSSDPLMNPSFNKESYWLISGKDSGNLKNIHPKDADTLQPVNIDPASVKQFWITVHIPENAVPGEYEGKIILTGSNVPPGELTLNLRVLPFFLEKSPLIFSIYYTGRLNNDGKVHIESQLKSREQYLAEMQNLRAHGVEYPTIYQGDEKLLKEELEIRAKAGLPKGSLYSLGITTGNPKSLDQLEVLKNKVRIYMGIAKEYGYDQVYFYGIDEAKGDLLKSQRPAWDAVRQAGGRVFVACYKGTFETLGTLLNLAVAGFPYDPQEAEKYHKLGHQIFKYGHPKEGQEQPEPFRRLYGVSLWKSGYDGEMVWAYQDGYGSIWDDFDSKPWRDHVLAYPTANGVIDTLQWEGFREGVNDVRYFATLEKAIRQGEGKKPKLASEAKEWLDKIDSESDLNILRDNIIKLIIKLHQDDHSGI